MKRTCLSHRKIDFEMLIGGVPTKLRSRNSSPQNSPNVDNIEIFTIGFTQKTARKFFELLKQSGTKRIVDVRLNNVSQLAGFAKREDLKYFAETICGIEYIHSPELAPSQE